MKGMIVKIRKSRIIKIWSLMHVLLLLLIDIHPLLALSGGPKTPESVGFSSITPAENVNLYTGDFQYTIPLFEMSGYPFTLTYDSNISMEQEASWVGLGWNLDIGSIDRQVKGLPDDFNNDEIIQTDNQRPNITAMLGIGAGVEVIGIKPDKAPLPQKLKEFVKSLTPRKFQIGYNTYNGFMWNLSGSSDPIAVNLSKNTEFSAGFNLGWNIGSGGLSVFPSLSLGMKKEEEFRKMNGNFSLSFNVNSLSGIQGTHYGYSLFEQKLEAFHLSAPNEYGQREVLDFHYVNQSHSGSISYQQISFPPKNNIRYQNFIGAINVKVPIETFWTSCGTEFSGYFGMQKTHQKQQILRGVGYLYMENKPYAGDVLTDIYREKDAGYMPGVPALPQTHTQPDVFSVHTKGISGNYRGYKNSAAFTGYSDFIANKGTDIKLDFEFGPGNAFKGALNPTFAMSKNTQGWWIGQNLAYSPLINTNYFSNTYFHNIYFKRIDESGMIINNSYFNATGGDKAIAFDLSKSGFNYYLKNQLITEENASLSAGGLNAPKFNQLPEFSTTFFPVRYDNIIQHPLYAKLYQQYYNGLPSNAVKNHHITHIEVVGENGFRYVFACPAYNTYQKEVSFNTNDTYLTGSGLTSGLISSLTSYSANDASVSNNKGLSHHFHSQITPSYVYAYHLTEVYNPEYSDLTGNGPTPDDAGDYLIFHYKKAIAGYKWRTPVTSSNYKGLYNAGAFSKDDDGMCIYTYGEKDIWYVDTIRNKYQMAVFYTSPRNDTKEAAGEHGGTGSRSLYKLDSILLYDVQAIQAYQKHPSIHLRPIKRIIFNYDYSLCLGVPNSTQGKLSLKSVEILNGDSYSEKHSSYVFTYSSYNPNYSLGSSDRWGNYKPSTPFLGNVLYPYSVQNKALADSSAKAWRLVKVTMPGSGSIEVEYESDDYKYVQNKKAMQMFLLYGVYNGNNAPSGLSNVFTSSTVNISPHSWLIFKTDIPSSYSTIQAQQEFNKYFDEDVMNKMYFKVAMNVTMPGSSAYNPVRYEYITGFAEIHNKAVFKDGNTYYGAIQLESVKYKLLEYHPFEMGAQQWVMTSAPLFYQDKLPITTSDNPEDVVSALVTNFTNSPSFFVNQFVALLAGPYKYMKLKGIGQTLMPSISWVRLCSRNEKYSGTARVKKIKYSNNWQARTGESKADIVHIKEYKYILPDGSSSGVAVNEPGTGSDETSIYTAMAYQNNTTTPSVLSWTRKLIPRQEYLYYGPLNSSDFPGASIGYSRVEVHTRVPSQYTSTGWEEHTFYTAKDYPVITKSTPLLEHHPAFHLPYSFVQTDIEHIAVSQGFCTILNDMPGRIKETKIFDGNGNLISKKTLHYSFDEVNFLNSNNTIFKDNYGLDVDVVVDWREEVSLSPSFQVQFNLDVSLFGIVPVPIPTGWPYISNSQTIFRSSVINKIIYQHSVVTKEDILDRSADLSVFHRVMDPVNGKDIVTSVKDRWGKEEYSFSLPAYHVYPKMGSGSVNTGTWHFIQTNGNGKVISGLSSLLIDGDKLLEIKGNGTGNRFVWVYKVNNDYYLIDKDGQPVINVNNPLSSNYFNRSYFLVYQSGYVHRLDDKAEQYTSKKSPLAGTSVVIQSATEILSASATTYTDYFSFVSDSCKVKCPPPHCGTNLICTATKTLSYVSYGAQTYSFSCSTGWGTVAPVSTTSSYTSSPMSPYSPSSASVGISSLPVSPTSISLNTSSVTASYTGSTISSQLLYAPTVTKTSVPSQTMSTNSFLPPVIPASVTIINDCSCKSEVIISISCVYASGCNYSISCLNAVGGYSPAISGNVSSQLTYTTAHLCPGTYTYVISSLPPSPSNTPYQYYLLVQVDGISPLYTSPNITLNPYIHHLKNAWRPYQSYIYYVPREPSAVHTPVRLPFQSQYKNIVRFWNYTSGGWLSNASQWKLGSTILYTDVNGNPIEEKDVSGIYSASWYVVNRGFQEGTIYNARSEEVAFESFEYYFPDSLIVSYFPRHFEFLNAKSYLSTQFSHTGLYSAKLNVGDSLVHRTFITSRVFKNYFGSGSPPPYSLYPGYFSDKFAPMDSTRTYRISLWVKSIASSLGSSNLLMINNFGMSSPLSCPFDSSCLRVSLKNTVLPVTKISESPEIEGWKQYCFGVQLTNMAPCDELKIVFKNLSGCTFYIDDIRIEPQDALSKIYVYYPYDKLLAAVLDENNFATRYIYNFRRELQEIIKETEKGNVYVQYKKAERR